MQLEWYMVNGRNHVRDKDEPPGRLHPWTGLCGIQPMLEELPPVTVYDTVTEIPADPCRSCLMIVALGDDVISEEPLDFARGRGYEAIDGRDLAERGVTSSEPPVL